MEDNVKETNKFCDKSQTLPNFVANLKKLCADSDLEFSVIENKSGSADPAESICHNQERIMASLHHLSSDLQWFHQFPEQRVVNYPLFGGIFVAAAEKKE